MSSPFASLKTPSLEALLVLPQAARLEQTRSPPRATVVASVVTDVAAKRLWVLLAYGQRLIGVALERSLVETPASRSNARRCERSFEPEGSITGSIPTAYWSSCNSSRPKKPRCARLL